LGTRGLLEHREKAGRRREKKERRDKVLEGKREKRGK